MTIQSFTSVPTAPTVPRASGLAATVNAVLTIASRDPRKFVRDRPRGVFYAGQPDYPKIVLTSPFLDLTIMGAMFLGFLVIGTTLFVRAERNR